MADENPNQDAKKTPEKWSTLKDARQLEGAGKYPNYYTHKTRSGHTFMMDDSKGAEHVTLQHRSGSAIQFMPGGAIQFTAHNGSYSVIFGENRMTITGAQDVTVQGSASLRVEGDYNVNVKGKAQFNVNGDFNINAKNLNTNVRGNMDVQAKNKMEKLEGSSSTQAHGAVVMVSKGGMTLGSTGDSLGLGGKNKVAIVASGGALSMKAGGKASIKAGGGTGIDGGMIKLNSGFADDAESDFSQGPVQPPSTESNTPTE